MHWWPGRLEVTSRAASLLPDFKLDCYLAESVLLPVQDDLLQKFRGMLKEEGLLKPSIGESGGFLPQSYCHSACKPCW